MNDKRLLINALLLLIFALGIVYSFRYTKSQNESINKTASSSSSVAIWFSSSISAKNLVQVSSASSENVSIRKLNQSFVVTETMPVQKTLEIEPRYTLKYLDTYIFNLGKLRNTETLSKKVKSLWWEMNYMTPNEIQTYSLAWEKFAFINIPSQKDKNVLMTLFDWKDMWLVVVPTETYQTRKKSLKALFNQ